MKQKTGKNNQNEIKKAQEKLKEILAAFEESEKHCSEAIKLWMQIDPTIKEKVDSLNALVRTPEYQKDIEELESFEWDEETFEPKDNEGYEKKHNEIMNKYNIFDVIFNKKDGSPDLLSYYSPEVFQDKSVVVLENEKFKDLRDEKGKLIGTDISPHLFENKYLMLQVDLTKKLQEIIKAFKETIKSYRKYVVRKTPRDKSYTTDIWSIYDKSTQKKISQIAKELAGINENPTYNPEVMRQYKRVKRAVDTANKRIKKESEELSLPQTKYRVIPL